MQAGKLARSIWAETCATEEKDAILGVQQARNAMTACTYLATISVAMATAGEYSRHPERCHDCKGERGVGAIGSLAVGFCSGMCLCMHTLLVSFDKCGRCVMVSVFAGQ